MKKLILTLAFFTAAVAVQAQDLSKPKNGNAIRLKENVITIEQGEELDIQMWIVKAKKYKLKLGDPKASGKEGVDFAFGSRGAEDPIAYNVKVKVDADTPTGDYNYILKVPGTGRNAVKNTIITVKVVRANP